MEEKKTKIQKMVKLSIWSRAIRTLVCQRLEKFVIRLEKRCDRSCERHLSINIWTRSGTTKRSTVVVLSRFIVTKNTGWQLTPPTTEMAALARYRRSNEIKNGRKCAVGFFIGIVVMSSCALMTKTPNGVNRKTRSQSYCRNNQHK